MDHEHKTTTDTSRRIRPRMVMNTILAVAALVALLAVGKTVVGSEFIMVPIRWANLARTFVLSSSSSVMTRPDNDSTCVYKAIGNDNTTNSICAVEGSNSTMPFAMATSLLRSTSSSTMFLFLTSVSESMRQSWTARIRALLAWLLHLLRRYLSTLERYPLLTKSISAGLIGGIGDLLAQRMERRVVRYMLKETSNVKGKDGADKIGNKSLDWYRSWSVTLEGVLVSGPLMHYFYDFLDSIIPVATEGSTTARMWSVAGLHVFIDAAVMDSIFVGSMMITTAVLEGQVHLLFRQLRMDYVDAVKVSWCSSFFFAPVQCALFRFVPLPLRVLAMNVQDIIWSAAISHMTHRSRGTTTTTTTTVNNNTGTSSSTGSAAPTASAETCT